MDQVTSSAGLTNMSDRLAAVGGVLVIRTAPGTGTCVSGTVPLRHNGNALNRRGRTSRRLSRRGPDAARQRQVRSHTRR